MWLFIETKVGDTKENFVIEVAHVLGQRLRRLMPLWLLTLWVNMAGNKLKAHKEEMTFQKRPRSGNSTRKRNCKAQPLPHPTHASYKWGIRKIPFICADSFPALGFSYLSFIWLINLFMEMCNPHRTNCLFQPLICKERVRPKEGRSEKDKLAEWVLNEAALPNLL